MTPQTVPPESVGVVGCGYLGRTLASLLQQRGMAVFATTRARAAELAAAGVTPITLDVTAAHSCRALSDYGHVGAWVYAVGYDRRASASMATVYIDGVRNVLASLPPAPVVAVSSTSVYGDAGGGWVTESTPPSPRDESGRVVLAAEAVWRELRPDATLLRFAGLYGPGRLLREQALKAGQPLASWADGYLNLIHVGDGAAAIADLLARGLGAGGTFNASDGHPVTRREFYTHLAETLGAPAAEFAEVGAAPGEANRRVDSRKLWALLGRGPALASYVEGIAGSLPATG